MRRRGEDKAALDRRAALAGLAAAGLGSCLSSSQGAAQAAVLRAAWLDGNPVQARKGADGRPHGPAADVAEALARRLSRPLELSAIAGTAGVLDAVRKGDADLGFVAYDPSRAQGLTFTPPYLLSLNQFAVRADSALQSPEAVDRPGVRVAAVPTDTGGLYLQRTLRSAMLVAETSVDQGLAQLLAGSVDVLAANGQRLSDLRTAQGGFRILPGSFFAVPQAIAVRADDQALAAEAGALVKSLIASGEIARSIQRWGLTGAAPAQA